MPTRQNDKELCYPRCVRRTHYVYIRCS